MEIRLWWVASGPWAGILAHTLMMLRVFFLLSLLFPVLTLNAQVKASLVAESETIVPGGSILVGLRLEHDKHWHTYWKNPGIGISTRLEWKLPEGLKAGEMEWPIPQVILDRTGAIVGNGYEGDLLLPVRITADASIPLGTKLELSAKASWLMCEEACIPGQADLKLTLDAAASAKTVSPWAARLGETERKLPAESKLLAFEAKTDGEQVRLDIRVAPQTSGGKIPEPERFFEDDGVIAFDAPQHLHAESDGAYFLDLIPARGTVFGPYARLKGVLRFKDSGEGSGLLVDVPLVKTAKLPEPGEENFPSSSASSAQGSGALSLLGSLGLALVGGLILNLMPCVFPVLGIKVLGFVQQAGAERRKVVMHGLVFTLGVLLSFWVLAATLALLRAGGAELGWGFQLQSPAFVYVLAVIMLVFGLNMSGVFEFGLSATSVGSSLQMKSGYAGSFFTGILATLVATPCSAPFLAPALGAALSLSTTESFLIFTAIALGLSAPYLLLSLFPSAVRLLPRPGAWMETFKQCMAFPLYGTVAFLLWVLAAQVQDSAYLGVLLSLVLISLGCWLAGRRSRIYAILSFLLLASGLVAGWPRAQSPTAIVWEPWSPARVAELRAEKRIIYVDFTARWCATCQTNKKLVFGSEEVLRVFANKRVATLKADWTNRDPAITEELARWGRSAVPFNLVYLPGRETPVVLPELLGPATVLEALR